jgi:GNAT superfamily N-acetyltransferase
MFDLACQWPPGSWLVERDLDGSYVLDEKRLSDPSWCVIVANDDRTRQLVGYLVGYNSDHFGPARRPSGIRRIEKIEEVAVLQDSQRKGIGRLLVAAFEDWARRTNLRVVELGGGAAPGFYEKLGYKLVNVG